MSEKTKKLNDSSVARLTTASASDLISVVHPTTGAVEAIEYQKLKAQLKAELLADKSVGNTGGKIPTLAIFPGYEQLSALGYTPDEHKNKSDYYFEGLCRWIVDNGLQSQILIGMANPNVQGLFIFTSLGNIKDGMPSYGAGMFLAYGSNKNAAYMINIYNGVFSFATGWGGVKPGQSARYAIGDLTSFLTEGRWQHEQDESCHRANVGRHSVESDGLPWCLSESGHRESGRMVDNVRRNGLRESSFEFGWRNVAIRNSGSIRKKQGRIPTDAGSNGFSLSLCHQRRAERLGSANVGLKGGVAA